MIQVTSKGTYMLLIIAPHDLLKHVTQRPIGIVKTNHNQTRSRYQDTIHIT